MGKYFVIIQKLTKVICVFATVSLVGMWLFIYNLDKDSSVIENKKYFGTDDDKFPVMSLCFEQFYDDIVFQKIGENISATAYKEFLLGNYFEKRFTAIDYDNVTTNISDFLWKYEVEYRNGTELLNIKDDIGWKPFHYTYSWDSWNHFLKCFGFQITDRNLYHVRIYIRREIFENNVNDVAGAFAVLFHYPNQVISSMQTVKRQWVVWDNNTNHYISFNIKGLAVSTLRYKDNNCIAEWKNYDNITLENHLKIVGCKRPDQITDSDFPLCNSKEKMLEARIRLCPLWTIGTNRNRQLRVLGTMVDILPVIR